MCGICGFTASDSEILKSLTGSLTHRGPDDRGTYQGDRISLGHTRLSIIDLSSRGAQPMFSPDQSVVVVFNGEIYNFQELKKDYLEDYQFKGNADSEVLPYLYEKLGIQFIHKLRGIFSIALYDKKNKTLFLIRDRFGVKPLYYTFQNGICYFSSEIKSFARIPQIQCEIDFNRYVEYLGLQYVPGKNTIFKNIFRVEPGTYLEIKGESLRTTTYYSLPEPSESGQSLSEEEHRGKIEEQILESLKYRLISDVPIGILLSGGLDSSSIVALLSKLQVPDINTFSVGFGQENDELKYAKLVSETFSTNHTEIIIDANDIKKHLPQIVYSLDEPLADTGAFASWLVFKHVRENSDIKVALVGEGADELFGGYSWHSILAKMAWVPETFKNQILFALTSFANSSIKEGIYQKIFLSQLQAIEDVDYVNKVLRFEFKNNLLNNLLMKVDKTSMAFGIEAREVFLDHKLVEAVFSCPGKLKVGKSPKYILKKTMEKSLPSLIVNRRKQGFIMPVNHWIHNELKEDILDALTDSKSYLRELFSKAKIQTLFKRNRFSPLRTISNNSLLWRAYLFEIYRREYSGN